MMDVVAFMQGNLTRGFPSYPSRYEQDCYAAEDGGERYPFIVHRKKNMKDPYNCPVPGNGGNIITRHD